MIAFLSRHLRKIFSVLTVLAVLSMLFFGISNARIPEARAIEEKVYKIGSKGHERTLSKSRIENMKTFLMYDLGVGFNDSLECQNIFSDGFCLNILNSELGKQLSKRYFSLIKEDFEAVVKLHRGHRLYRHPSGKLTLLKEMKNYANNLYIAYEQVQNKERDIDLSLFHDYITLATEQRKCRPCDMKKLMSVFVRDKNLGQDPTLERKNFALFQAKSNADMFGDSFMELLAQVVIEGAAFAREHGYSTSYEEASGIIGRLSAETLLKKYPNIESESALENLQEQFRIALGLSKKDLVIAASDTITFDKMLADVDGSILIDKMVVKKLYNDSVENLHAKIIQDHPNMNVRSIESALELDCYLEALGDKDGFLSVPKAPYDQKTLLEKTPELSVKNYSIKVASRSKNQVADTISLKEISNYQVSNDGWEKISKNFSFDSNLAKENRFAFIKNLEKEQTDKVDQFSRLEIVAGDHDLIRKELEIQELLKGVYGYNKLVPSTLFGKNFNDKLLVNEIDNLSINEELSCYTQDGDQFFRVMLLEKPQELEFATFDFAKKNRYLTELVNAKLKALNNGSEVEEEKRVELLKTLLTNLAGKEVFEAIEKAISEKKFYAAHSEKRLNAQKEGSLNTQDHPLLNQFSITEKKDVISRVGNTKEFALESYFQMKAGDLSAVASFNNGLAYYIELLAYKFDDKKIEKYADNIKLEITKEAQNAVYKDLIAHFEKDNMIAIERFKQEIPQ